MILYFLLWNELFGFRLKILVINAFFLSFFSAFDAVNISCCCLSSCEFGSFVALRTVLIMCSMILRSNGFEF